MFSVRQSKRNLSLAARSRPSRALIARTHCPPAEGSGSESASTACTTKQSLRSDWCSNFPAAFSTALAPPPAGGQNKQGLFCLVLGTSGGATANPGLGQVWWTPREPLLAKGGFLPLDDLNHG